MYRRASLLRVQKMCARCSGAVLCATTGNRTRVCFTSKRGVSVSTTFCVRVCGRHGRNDESRLSSWSTYLLRTARENCERVDDFRRQEFHILGYPTSDRSAFAILLRDVPCWQAVGERRGVTVRRVFGMVFRRSLYGPTRSKRTRIRRKVRTYQVFYH